MMDRNERETATTQSWLHGATVEGKRPARSHDFLFLGSESKRFAVVGREIREDWSKANEDGEQPAMHLLADLANLMWPPGHADPASPSSQFDEGFRGIVERAQRRMQQQGDAPAIALTVAYAHRGDLYVGHVGDGRCYLASNGQLERLTEDQTYTPQPPDRPLVSDPAMSRKLSSVVGGFSDDLVAQTKRVPLAPGSTVLLCSAGINRVLSETHVQMLVREATGRSAKELCEAVLEASQRTLDGADRTVAAARFP